MLGILLKFFFLLAALKIHDIQLKPLAPTLAYSIPVVIFGLLLEVPLMSLLIAGVITLCVAYVYFELLTKFNDGGAYYAIMLIGGILMVIFI